MKDKRLQPNYRYQIRSTIQVEGRKSYIKNLRAQAMYMEENVTDEEFHMFATGEKRMTELNTYKFLNMDEL